MKVLNKEDLAMGDMKEALLEKQPLPIGRTQFIEWSNRIIEAAVVDATHESLRFSLAAMLMHLGPTEAFREDAYFVLSLRKAAVNQTAHAMMEELKLAQEAKKKQAEETAAKPFEVISGPILENKRV